MELAAELEASLKEFSASGLVEVRENGRAAPLEGLSWEIRGSGQKPLLHIWSERYNVTRRVLAITDHSEQRLALAVERFGRLKPDRLEFVRRDFERQTREVSRQQFCERMKEILAQQFPDEVLESLVIGEDLEHSLPGNYARGILRRGSTYRGVLAVSENESPETIAKVLTFGLLWLDHLRSSTRIQGSVAGLRLILPSSGVRSVAHSCAALACSLGVRLFALDSRLEVLEEVNANEAGNVDSWLVPHRDFQNLLDRAQSTLAPIVALAPRHITLHPTQSRAVILRFRGLQFAAWEDGQLFFLQGESLQLIRGDATALLKAKLHELELHRNPLATDTRHALYRAQPERWLEALVRVDVTRIDACLDARFVYIQVFANVAGDHGILDLLCATRSGRLAILELKANEYIHLPLQASDYWLRIRRHLQQGDFQRFGYFPGMALQNAAPVVYMVAPALRFHPTTDMLLRPLTRELEVVRVGLAENWRHGLRVVQRQ